MESDIGIVWPWLALIMRAFFVCHLPQFTSSEPTCTSPRNGTTYEIETPGGLNFIVGQNIRVFFTSSCPWSTVSLMKDDGVEIGRCSKNSQNVSDSGVQCLSQTHTVYIKTAELNDTGCYWWRTEGSRETMAVKINVLRPGGTDLLNIC